MHGLCAYIGNCWCVSIRDIDKRKEINSMYECEKARMLQLLTHIGLYNSVITLAEKYQDFATLMSVCENSTEPRRSEMLHDYMVRFVNEVRNGKFCQYSYQIKIFQRVLQNLCFKSIKSKVSVKIVV